MDNDNGILFNDVNDFLIAFREVLDVDFFDINKVIGFRIGLFESSFV